MLIVILIFYYMIFFIFFFFFFQAEDGIRDTSVTGVQTCALPILHGGELDVALLQGQPADVHRRRVRRGDAADPGPPRRLHRLSPCPRRYCPPPSTPAAKRSRPTGTGCSACSARATACSGRRRWAAANA